ncbi:hypothetical protein [Vulgatibacter sp.]|uniref:hypothetical protein n=1 Tax=Vulgatibacter sp. TaxID=1971226 RepID=UPI003565A62E
MRPIAPTLALALLAAGCTFESTEPESCSVQQLEDGSTAIRCGDGTTAHIPATEACTVVENGDGTSTITCPDGTTSTVGGCSVEGNDDGTRTITCADGTSVTVRDGEDGSSCSVADNGDGTKTISCTDGTEVTVRDGADAPESCTVTPRGDGTLLLTCPDGSTRIIPVEECDGTLRGGDFANAAAWELSGGARIDTQAQGDDPGVLRFDTAAMCGGAAAAVQRVCVPPYVPGEALRLRSRVGLRGCLDGAECFGGYPSLLVGGFDVGFAASGPTGFMEHFSCLGENHYGRAFDVGMVAVDDRIAPACPVRSVELEVDAIELEPAPRGFCPPPGTIFNGGFDAEGGLGWELLRDATWWFDGTDREAQLSIAAGSCGAPWLRGFVSVPAQPLPNVAVEFTARGNAGNRLALYLTGHTSLEVTATGEPQTVRRCLAPTSFGNTLEFGIHAHNYDSETGGCPQAVDWRIDDIRFVSDPLCVANP